MKKYLDDESTENTLGAASGSNAGLEAINRSNRLQGQPEALDNETNTWVPRQADRLRYWPMEQGVRLQF